MDALDILTKKVHQAASEIISLKKEKNLLSATLNQLRGELDQANKQLRESEQFRHQQEKIRTRLEKLSRKIDKHLMSDQPLMATTDGAN